jgi:hypothetical protein
VTLIAGIDCHDGIVIGADSQESSFYRKSEVTKVMTHSSPPDTPGPSLIIAGAGNGSLADFAAHRILTEVSSLAFTTLIEQKIIEVLKDIFSTQVPLHPVRNIEEASFQLLIALHASDSFFGPNLYSTDGATLNKRPAYYALGSGALVDYILDKFGRSPKFMGLRKVLSIEEGTGAIEYMLQIAKEYVEGVGGKSQIVVMRADGTIDEKVHWEISENENVLTQFEILNNHLMLNLFHSSDTEFKVALKEFNKEVAKLRKQKKKTDKKIADFDAWIAAQDLGGAKKQDN